MDYNEEKGSMVTSRRGFLTMMMMHGSWGRGGVDVAGRCTTCGRKFGQGRFEESSYGQRYAGGGGLKFMSVSILFQICGYLSEHAIRCTHGLGGGELCFSRGHSANFDLDAGGERQFRIARRSASSRIS